MNKLKVLLENPKILCMVFWPAWFLVIGGLLLWILHDMGIRYNATPSLPQGLYWLTSKSPGKGDLASFCLDGKHAEVALSRGYLKAGICPSGVRPLLKKVAALPGDSLTMSSSGISVNGELQRYSAPRIVDSQGRTVNMAFLPDIVPEGMALMLSDHHEGSFDSRYFGLIPLEKLQLVKPFFTKE